MLEKWRTCTRLCPAALEADDGVDGDTEAGTSSGHSLYNMPTAISPQPWPYLPELQRAYEAHGAVFPMVLLGTRGDTQEALLQGEDTELRRVDGQAEPVGALEDRHAVVDYFLAFAVESGLLFPL